MLWTSYLYRPPPQSGPATGPGLGNDGAAAECARLGTTAQKKKALSADCRCVLGRVAARQGSADEADKEFKLVVEEAMDARCYALLRAGG